MFARRQLILEIVTNLRDIQSIHDAGGGIWHIHFSDLGTVEHTDIPTLRCLVFQRTINLAIVIANVTDMCTARNRTGGQAGHGAGDSTGVHIYLDEHIGEGGVKIVPFIICANALQMTCAALGCHS